MLAIAQDRHGGVDRLSLRELPEPVCRPEDVIVAVEVAALNPSDWNIRQGRARVLTSHAFPLVLGSDVSGRIAELGSAVSDWQVGDEVFGVSDPRRLGTLAQRVAIDARRLARKPRALSHSEAAALPVVGQTAWCGLFEQLRVRAGERLLVLGGSGGVGAAAIQLARAAGASVLATAGARNLERVAKLGAETALDYRDPLRFQRAAPVDAVFDTVGAPERLRAFAALRPGGRLVSIAGIPTGDAAAQHGVGRVGRALFELASAREHLAAWRAGARYAYFFLDATGQRMREVAAACETQGLRAPIDCELSFRDFRRGFERLESGHPDGKVLLRWS